MSETKFFLKSPQGHIVRFERDGSIVWILWINCDGTETGHGIYWVSLENARRDWQRFRKAGWERYQWEFPWHA